MRNPVPVNRGVVSQHHPAAPHLHGLHGGGGVVGICENQSEQYPGKGKLTEKLWSFD